MAGLVPAIHALSDGRKTWMPATSAGMTPRGGAIDDKGNDFFKALNLE